MSLQNLVSELAEFNAWANQRYLKWLAPLADEMLDREIPSSCPSIIKTLKHIWEAQEYWYGAVAETADFVKVWEIANPTRQMIFEGLGSNSRKLADFVPTMTDDDLSMRLRIDNDWLNCDLTKYEYLQQVFHHATYHRGQIVTMAHNLGVTGAPSTDFLIWATRG